MVVGGSSQLFLLCGYLDAHTHRAADDAAAQYRPSHGEHHDPSIHYAQLTIPAAAEPLGGEAETDSHLLC